MDTRTVQMLKRINDGFYRRCASSFSQTRQTGWAGWEACAPFLLAACRDAEAASGSEARELAVLDLACGNGRFEAFLSGRLADVRVSALAVDNCDDLLAKARSVAVFRHFDALEALIGGASWAQALGDPGNAPADSAAPAPFGSFDVAVSFGFFHHIPSAALRAEALRQLLAAVRPGGTVIVSLWCFLEDDRLARKAEVSHVRALRELDPLQPAIGAIASQPPAAAATPPSPQPAAATPLRGGLAARLEPNDRFLDWQGQPGLWRYCHSFDDAEADRLSAAVALQAREVARFRSDGKSGRLNIYLVFRKHWPVTIGASATYRRKEASMNLVCLDLEGVLVPEIWIAFAEATGIPELKRTTRDEPDYDKLMEYRLSILAEHGLGLPQIQQVIAGIDPLPGAREFLDALRERTQTVIISDTFEQFAAPLMRKLGWPTLFCNTLEVADDGKVTGYAMRCPETKLTTVRAFQSCGMETIAAGDSHNDLGMIRASKAGFLFRSTDAIKAENPDIPAFEDYDDLLAAIEGAL